MNLYECILDLGKVNPVREANSREEFIDNLLEEYNNKCDGLFDVQREDISKITSDDFEEDEEEDES
jgi:hypothetical protein